MAKDYSYIAKVGSKYLKGKGFTTSKSKASKFESETEPKQIINQLKKDGKLDKNVKVNITKLSEMGMRQPINTNHRFEDGIASLFTSPIKEATCTQCDGLDDNASVETWCKMDGVDEINFCDYFDIDPMKELCYECWHEMRDEYEAMDAERATGFNPSQGEYPQEYFDEAVLSEEVRKVAVAAGRCNPPTIGHEKLMNTLASQGCEARFYASHTCDPKKNPLSFETKTEFLDEAFGDKVNIMTTDARNMFEALHELYEEGFTEVTYICGGDRMEDGTAKQIEKYNGADVAEDKYYKFEKLNFVSAGSRDENAEDDASAASASKARKLAADGDIEKFKKICPSTLSDEDKEALYNAVRKGMNIKSEAVAMYDEERTAGFESYLNKMEKKTLSENDAHTEDAFKAIDFIRSNIMDFDYMFEGHPDYTRFRRNMDRLLDELENEIIDLPSTEIIELDPGPLNKLLTIGKKLSDYGSIVDEEHDGPFIKVVGDGIIAAVEAAQQKLLDVDYANSRDQEIDNSRALKRSPAMYNIYCTYDDNSGGEEDGDPRYEEVGYEEIEAALTEIINDFLGNRLSGSYKWSPVDQYTDDGETKCISTSEYLAAADQSNCEVNRLKIDICPYEGTEDSFKVIVDGDGEIVKDTFGLEFTPNL